MIYIDVGRAQYKLLDALLQILDALVLILAPVIQILHLDDNRMTALPVAIGSLVNLEELKIAGNALRDPPMKVPRHVII